MKKFDIEDVRFRTAAAVQHLNKLAMIVHDVRPVERREAQECRICFYDSKIGGAAMTNSNCKLCGVEMNFGSTNVDALCMQCAQSHKLCKHCGADVELKQRNSL